MSSYFWYQRAGGEEAWGEALSEHRLKILSEIHPSFVTVLDAHGSPDTTWTRDDYEKLKYSGPFYMDFDSESIEDTLGPFKEILRKLDGLKVNLKCLRLYATGGRGFHIEVPEEVFMPKVPKTGTTLLPYVYREVAFELVVDTLDMRVYTGRKGRMWRVPGVKRDNGNYKVSLTLDQALAMTPELYAELVRVPNIEPYREDPTLSTEMAAMFAKAVDRVSGNIKKRGKNKGDEATLAKFKGQFPATATRIMQGEGLLPGAGFHPIAMQLAILANALGKSADELVLMSEGLVQTHKGDSSRYASPRRRKEELRRMWEYTHDNPCYTYSSGGLRSICAADVPTSDLDGLSASVGIGHVPSDEEDEIELPKDVQDDIDSAGNSLLEGMMILPTGIYRRTAEGSRMVSNLSFQSPAQMIDVEDGMLVGLESKLVADGVQHGRALIDMPTFASRTNLSKFCSGRGAIFSGTDTMAGVVQLLLSRAARKSGKMIYIVHREGLDLVQNPNSPGRIQRDVVWASSESVLTHAEGVLYRFKPKLATSTVFRSDVHLAEPMRDTPDTRAWVTALLDVNSPVVVGQMLGWFVSCFHKQFYQAEFHQFPLLHPNGPAGSGKSLTTSLLARMFYATNPVLTYGCSVPTNFALKSAWGGSASIPLILDEYKPSEMDTRRHEFLLQHFRLLYNQGNGATGGINKGGAESSFRDITTFSYAAPTAYLGESQEMQTAIVQRSLPVSFNPEDAARHTTAWDAANAGAAFMSNLGASIMRASLLETVSSRAQALRPLVHDLRSQFPRGIHDRQVYNLAVVLCGIDYLGEVLDGTFGGVFKDQIAALREQLISHRADINVSAMTEAAKVVNDMSLISRTEDPDSEFVLREGREYLVGDGYVEILMRESFVKYFAWNKRKGFTPLYTSADAFITGLGKSPMVLDKTCFDSPLRSSGQSRVFRLSLEKLTAEGVEMFRSKSFG